MAAKKKKVRAGVVQLGRAYVFRGVTMIDIGRVTQVGPDGRWVRLDKAGWVADTGRFGTFLENGSLNEFEPYPHGCVVMLGSICEILPWSHPLPRVAQ